MNYLAVVIFSLLPSFVMAELKPMEFDDMDEYLSEIPNIETSRVDHKYNIQANFNIGTTRVSDEECRNRHARKSNSFYGCWLNQMQPFLDKLSFLLNNKTETLRTNLSFKISESGNPIDIKITGFDNAATKEQLTNILKNMEFGTSQTSVTQVVNIRFDSNVNS